MPAQGQILSEAGLLSFLGQTSMTVISNQSTSASGNNSAGIQSAFNYSEARMFAKLLTMQATPGVSFFKYPLTVGGIAIGTATTSLAFNTLSLIGYQYSTRVLGIWRMLLSTPDDSDGGGGENPLANRIAAFGKQADDMLEEIVRWAQGYTCEATYTDLDLNSGAVVGAPCTTIALPKFGRAHVNPSGMPIQFVTDGPLPWVGWPVSYGFYPPFGDYGWGW